jgi:hypothetical protein
MKLLFFSPVDSEIAEVEHEFLNAGIPCEVRHAYRSKNDYGEAELWIRNDRDSHRALMLCVQLGVGFAKRPARRSLIESWSDFGNELEQEDEFTPRFEQPAEEHLVENNHAPRHRIARHRH